MARLQFFNIVCRFQKCYTVIHKFLAETGHRHSVEMLNRLPAYVAYNRSIIAADHVNLRKIYPSLRGEVR